MKLEMSGLTKDFVMMLKYLDWRFVKVVFARALALCFHCPFWERWMASMPQVEIHSVAGADREVLVSAVLLMMPKDQELLYMTFLSRAERVIAARR
jgi:hypothetical protein